MPRVLLACECSGRVRDEFAERGWDAWSADILPSETPCRVVLPDGQEFLQDAFPDPVRNIGTHYQGDVRDLFSQEWDLVIAFPPCTDISLAGAAWFKKKDARKGGDGRMQEGMSFFMEMINAPAEHVAVENPRNVMFSEYRRPDQTVQPWWFGDPFKKNTCLWLKNLPTLVPEFDKPETLATVTSGDMKGYRLHKTVTSGSTYEATSHDFNGRQHYEDSEGRKNRAKVRSRTFPGVARAMASQWGAYLERLYDA